MSWAEWLRAGGRSRETIYTRTDHLRRAARALGGSPWSVTSAALMAWAGRQEWARETRRSMYASLRLFWAWAVEAGHVEISPAATLPRVAAADPIPRPCPAPVLAEAKGEADGRVGLMLRLGAELGMRRAEIARVHARDVVADLLGWSLVAHGKGGRDRSLPMTDDLARAVRAACGDGWAFPGRVEGHLSPRYVGKLMSEALAGGWTAHTLRHRFGTVTHEATGDLVSVSRLLGHRSVATTQRYVATDAVTLRRVAATAA